MIFKVDKRRKRDENGKLLLSRSYYLRYRIGDMPCDKWVSLRTTDKAAAQALAQKFITEKQRELAGIALPRKQVETSQKPVIDLLAQYIEELRTRGRDAKYIHNTEAQAGRVIRENRWARLKDISASSFETWRRTQRDSKPKTLNDYLSSVRGFLNWLVEQERLSANPLAKVRKIDLTSTERRKRRPFIAEELVKLCAVSGKRALVYQFTAFTGVRRGELKKLQWGDIVKDEDGLYLDLRETITKNRQAARIPLMPQLADEIEAMRPQALRLTDRLFPYVPRMERFRKDLKAAGIAYEDERGKFADFHPRSEVKDPKACYQAPTHTIQSKARNLARMGCTRKRQGRFPYRDMLHIQGLVR